jgi:transposase
MAHGIEITRSDFTALKLRRLASKEVDAKAVRRILAIAMVLEGADRTEAAEACGMDRQTLRDWVHRYNDEGIAGLSNRKGQGRPPALTQAQMETFSDWVRTGPDITTDGVVRWRCVDLQRKIKEAFDVDVHERTVGKLLSNLNFVRISVRPQHPSSAPGAQEDFKKVSRRRSARAFQKMPAASHSKSGSRMRPV